MLVIGNLEKTVQKISNVDELITITEEDYFDFQNMIRVACGDKP
jgi:hypothetical protein